MNYIKFLYLHMRGEIEENQENSHGRFKDLTAMKTQVAVF